jgi:hypothetical protein
MKFLWKIFDWCWKSFKLNFIHTPIKNFPQKFHKLTATMIKGVPNDTHFGIGTPDGFPSELLTSNADVYFNSIARKIPVTGEEGHSVYRVFSNILSRFPVQ